MKALTVFALVCALMALTGAAEESNLVKRSTFCSSGWSEYNHRCFYYNPRLMTWAAAEKYCESLGGNLASVHNMEEYHKIQKLTVSRGYQGTWIGGSDAQQDNQWFWSDGKPFHFSNWCHGEPNNHSGRQHCIQINHRAQKCWDDYKCSTHKPSVCAKKITLFWR